MPTPRPPATVDGLVGAALDAGATVVKPVIVEGGHRPGTQEIAESVPELGVADVPATRRFYIDRSHHPH